MAALHSYVVRYDSGFAPNPFYGYCTLATCKPDIRRAAQVGDWILGSGSDAKGVRLGRRLVYAMQVTEAMTFASYNSDVRFERKKPFRNGSRKQSCGDNIYFKANGSNAWSQRDSFHSNSDGTKHGEHVRIDTAVDRVLISDDFVYFGSAGPEIPGEIVNSAGQHICKKGIGRSCFREDRVLNDFVAWIRALGARGYQDAPFEWVTLRG